MSVVSSGNPRLLGIQLVAAISVAAFASLGTFLILSILKHVPHLGLRPSAEEEAAGLDLADHGAAAYMVIAAASVLHRSMQLRGINTSAVLRRSLTALPAASSLAASIEEGLLLS